MPRFPKNGSSSTPRCPAWGRTGPLRDKKAFDLTVQAEAKLVDQQESLGGSRSNSAHRCLISCAASMPPACVTALYQRTQSGCLIETSLFEGLVAYGDGMAADEQFARQVGIRAREHRPV